MGSPIYSYARHWVDKGLFKAILPAKYSYQIPLMLITSNQHTNTPLAQAMIKQIKRSHGVTE
ncbi:hypothetical protein ABGI54_05815 [Rheinheimera sp. FR7-34]